MIINEKVQLKKCSLEHWKYICDFNHTQTNQIGTLNKP